MSGTRTCARIATTAVVRCAHVRAVLTVCLVLLTASSGCKTCTLPRIDPTGESLFAPGSTTLDPQLGRLPTPPPAFATPPTPQPCAPGDSHCLHSKKHIKLHCDKLVQGVCRELTCVGDEGQLQLTPATLVAAVGTEVVLLSGLCGPERTFVARQPIEWVLSHESVGHFVAVGEDGECSVTRLYKKQPHKASGTYAVGVSSASEQVITRGTPHTTDDFRIGKGQAWLSLTSPSEGTSYVTVLAPKAKNWDQRRQTAIIHWVDGQWQFPGPAIVPAGRKHLLTTVVRRQNGAVAATGWIVRYEVQSGEAAGFSPGGQPVVEVPVGPDGTASAELTQQAQQPGNTIVSVQILRPGAAGAAPMLVGQGYAAVTWSAPGLSVRISGSSIIPAGLEARFRIEVSNPGDLPTRDVVVSDTLPPGLELVESNPPPQLFGNRAEWRLGDLAAKQTVTIDVRTRAARGGDLRYCVRAKSADGAQAEDCFAARVSQDAIKLEMTGPATASVGDEITYRVIVENAGDQPLTNVQVRNLFDAGLEHTGGQASPITRSLGDMNPGERRQFGVSYHVRAAGQLCHTLDVSADGGQLKTERRCVQATTRDVRNLKVEKTVRVPEQAVGGMAEFLITVQNTGNQPLSEVQIVDEYAATLQPKNATDGFEVAQGALIWKIPTLLPGQTATRQVSCVCLKPDAGALNRVTVTSRDGATGSSEARVRIVDPNARVAPRRVTGSGDGAGGEATAGQLTLTATPSANPVRVGQTFSYFISVANERTVNDRDVRLRITLSDGLQFVRFRGVRTTLSADKRTVDISPVAEMRAGEKLPDFQLEVVAVGVGQQGIRLDAVSELSSAGVSHEALMTVNAQ